MNSNDMKGMSWETMLEVIDQTIAALESGDTEVVRDFLQRLAAKKTAERRTWGRMSLLAQDALITFNPSDSKKLREVLQALKAIAQIAQKK